jgi:hypothetical protein
VAGLPLIGEDVLDGAEVANVRQLDIELFAELAAQRRLARLAELDAATWRPKEGSPLWASKPSMARTRLSRIATPMTIGRIVTSATPT